MLWLHKAWDGRHLLAGKFGTRTALTAAMSNEDKSQCFPGSSWHGWLTTSHPGFNTCLFLLLKGCCLGEGDVEESGEILNILLQSYTRDDDSLGTPVGKRMCVPKMCRSWWKSCEEGNCVWTYLLATILKAFLMKYHLSIKPDDNTATAASAVVHRNALPISFDY